MQTTHILAGHLDQIPLLKVTGDLDRNNGSKAVEWAEQALGGGDRLLLLDLSDCSYVDSGGLGSLFAILQILNPRGVIGIYGASAEVYRLMELVGLVSTPAFRVFSDEAAVRAALEGGEFKFDL
jgi:anti-anti-sigma factor